MNSLALLCAFSVGAAAADLQEAFASAAARAKPAVVNITTVSERRLPPSHRFFFGEADEFERWHGRKDMRWSAEGTGSGVILDPRGYVVTNEHVVRGADAIKIGLEGPDGRRRTLPGKVVAADESLDLALVRIEAPGTYPALRLAAAPPKVGQWVLAIGSPFELEQTVTAGIVSARRQSLLIEGRRYHNLVQTDAAINHGNSGGPLVDLDGDVVGVNTAIFSPSGASAGVGFAVAAPEAADFLEAALAGKALRRGWLGVELAPVDDVLRRRFGIKAPGGAMVAGVLPGAPAEKAGLSRGDAVVEAGGRPVAGVDDLIRRVRRAEPGTALKLVLERDGRRRTAAVELGERPTRADGRAAAPDSGADPEEPAESSWEGVSFEASPAGPVVSRVAPDSPCFGYLAEGDLVREVNRRPVKDLESLRAALKEARVPEGVLFDVERRGAPAWVSVQGTR